MRVRLMFPDRDFKYDKDFIRQPSELLSDLELEIILSSMAAGKDELVYSVCRQSLLSPLQDADGIIYRQEVLKDCLLNPEAVKQLYKICNDTEERRRNSWYRLNSNRISTTYSSAIELLNIYTTALKELKNAADSFSEHFTSRGFTRFFKMIREELSDDYFSQISSLMRELNTAGGVLVSAGFGSYLQGVSYVLREKKNSVSKLKWLFAPTYVLAERDDAGASDLYNRKEKALNEPANALAQSAQHLGDFVDTLKTELAFYIGAVTLSEKLAALPRCFPEILPEDKIFRSWKGLYDGSLAILKKDGIVGNDMQKSENLLYIITGANQGGKTTFLRSIGQAQLMAQCGLFVFAEKFTVPIRRALFTHFKREEDPSMKSGKLDEELKRMSDIADNLQPRSMILFNESFSSTNERDGSEIFSQITRALYDNSIEAFSVTHLNTYAAEFAGSEKTAFLRAERLKDGSRSFKITEGLPLKTAYGEDIYKKVFN